MMGIPIIGKNGFTPLCWMAALLLLLSGVLSVFSNTGYAADASDFVQTSGTEFVLNGKTFYFAGTNNYYMHYKSDTMIDDVLSDASEMGLNVMRIWGFHDGSGQEGYVMQPEMGVYDESGFERLDYTIYKAGQMGIRLVIPFVNNWDDFGGMNQYVQWTGGGSHDDFYTRPSIKDAYKDYINYMLNRTNTYTGVKYKNDPTIMTWELANEPRASSDTSGDTLVNWADEMSTYVKSLDANHLVSVGDEGFYGISGHSSYPYSAYEGVHWERLTSLPNIDYGTYHLYPDHWDTTAEWGTQWIRDHIQDAEELGKPVVLEEFGYQGADRNQVYEEWTTAVEEEGGAGSQFWILTGIQDDGSLYADYDGFRVVYPGDTASVFSDHAQVMNEKSVPLTIPDIPENVTAEPFDQKVELTWSEAKAADTYNVKRSESAGGPYQTVASEIEETNYTDTELVNGTTYYYVVSASNSLGESPNAAEVNATPDLFPPGAFSLQAEPGNRSVALKWTDASDAETYTVKRAQTEGGPYETLSENQTETTYTDDGLENGTTYAYRVTAVNATGTTDSDIVTATPTLPDDIQAEYRVGDAEASDNQLKPQLQIANNGSENIPLEEITIRYWYTDENGQDKQYHCDYAVVGCSNIEAQFHTMDQPTEEADAYLEISFTSGAGSLAPDTVTGQIQNRINYTNWTNFEETNDYSYDGSQTSFAPVDTVTLYRNGQRIWGVEPQ